MALEAARVTGRDDSVTALFIVSAICTMALQGRATRWCRLRLTGGQSVALGLGLAALGWLPLMISSPLTAAQHYPLPFLQALIMMAPVLLGAIVMAAGGIIALPFIMDLMPTVGSERMMGTYYGYYSLVGGTLTAVGSAAIGATLSIQAASLRWLPFGVLFVLGVISVAIILEMQRRGALEPVEAQAV